ncbi:MAG TPA: DUF3761 domain-containing protein [Candidatus Polarisedimenticolia bacterium]|nr:DUF3761 domain-containing protein [Candidatus Polarisedimenticolia bacterium]
MTRRRPSPAVTTALALALFVAPMLAARLAADDAAKPGDVPHDATGRCHDDTWTASEKKKGACSQHGGLKAWFGKPPKGAMARCKDGTFSKSAGQGACSSHGGVAYEIKPPAKKS